VEGRGQNALEIGVCRMLGRLTRLNRVRPNRRTKKGRRVPALPSP